MLPLWQEYRANLSSIFQNLEGKMARLSICFCTLLLLLSFSMSESRPLRNDDPFSSYFSSSKSHFLSNIKHYLYPGSEGRSLAIESVNGFRNSNAARRLSYRPNRASPGGPDPHHHFKTGSSTRN
ncbi:hypothetical protein V8G54_003156 [Vigna mungo]|uniref:Uncharacterized protein n=1 Tax=Vigna mungo TaxID=3915 RepID=A0AAQ3PBJ5_VIGMU